MISLFQIGKENQFLVPTLGYTRDTKCFNRGTYQHHIENGQTEVYENYIVQDYYTVYLDDFDSVTVDGVHKLPYSKVGSGNYGFDFELGVRTLLFECI